MSSPPDHPRFSGHNAEPSGSHQSAWTEGQYGVALPLDGSSSAPRRGTPDQPDRRRRPPRRGRGTSRRPLSRVLIFFIVLFVGGFGLSAVGNFVVGGMLEGFDATAETGTPITVSSPDGEQVWVWTTVMTTDAQCSAVTDDGVDLAVSPVRSDIDVLDSTTGTSHVFRPAFAVDIPAGSATIICEEDFDSASTHDQIYAVGEPKSELVYDAEIFLTIAGAVAGFLGLVGIFVTRALRSLAGWNRPRIKDPAQ